MPVFICTANTVQRPRYSTQTMVIRNPRGQKWYYAFINRWFYNIGIERRVEIWKSPDGVTWSLSNTIMDYTTENRFPVVTIYDDGTQLIVYLIITVNDPNQYGFNIFYQRLRIPDDQTTPIVGTRQTIFTADNVRAGVIKMDRNGYVHVVFMNGREFREKGVGYWLMEPYIMGTTTPYPTDAPSWCTPQQVASHPDIKYVSWDAIVSFDVFGGTGDIGGVVYATRRSDGTQVLKGRDIVSYNGSSYTLGTDTEITTMPNYSECEYCFEIIQDDDLYVHLLYPYNVTNERLRHKKSSAISTVESWDAYTVVDDSDNAVFQNALAISIDKSASPNRLYAVYVFSAYQNNYLRWRSSPVDTIDWSDESTVLDDTERLWGVNMSDRDYEQGIYVMYDRWFTTLRGRFHEIPIAVPKAVEESTTARVRYLKGVAIIKRNGKIIAHVTPYTPYRTERPIQPA